MAPKIGYFLEILSESPSTYLRALSVAGAGLVLLPVVVTAMNFLNGWC